MIQNRCLPQGYVSAPADKVDFDMTRQPHAPNLTEAALANADPRMALVLRIERTTLAARYMVFLALGAFVFLGLRPPRESLLAILAVYGLLHNGFVHWALLTRRYRIFLTSANFTLHLAEITMMTAYAGAADSPLFLLYILFIIGFNTYSRLTRGALLVTLVCCTCYGIMVLIEQNYLVTETPSPLVAAKFLSIVMAGWLMGSLGEFLRDTEIALESRAQALASSEATLRMILDSTEEPILTHGESEFITDANGRACEFLGVDRDNLIGRRVRSFLFDDGTLPGKFATLRARGEYHGEALVVRPRGEECSVEMHVRAFIHDDKRFFVSVWRDITEQKTFQEATQRANLQLEHANRELQRLDELKSAFYANISQRVRSPLSAVLGFTDMLLNEELGSLTIEQRQALQSSRRGIQRIFALIDEVLRLDSSRSISPPLMKTPEKAVAGAPRVPADLTREDAP